MMDNNFSEYERNLALLGGHHIADAEAYFNARPQIDNDDRRKVFEAGYERGWEALRQQLAKRSLQATPEPADKEYLEWKSLKEEALQLKEVLLHDSDCAVHNEPAYPNGECNCKLAKPAVDYGKFHYDISSAVGILSMRLIDDFPNYKETETGKAMDMVHEAFDTHHKAIIATYDALEK
jgi:hypothetical protein